MVPLTNGPGVFQGTDTVTDEEIGATGPTSSGRSRASAAVRHDNAVESPPTFRKGHLTSLLTAGILDGKVETVDGPMILKGFPTAQNQRTTRTTRR